MTTAIHNDEAPVEAGASLNSLLAFCECRPCSGPSLSTEMLNRSQRAQCLSYAVDGCNVANPNGRRNGL